VLIDEMVLNFSQLSQVKLFMCVIKHLNHEGIGVCGIGRVVPSFCNAVLGGEWSASCHRCFTPLKQVL